MKYKIIQTLGCTTFNVDINDKPISNYSQEELYEILEYLFAQIKTNAKTGEKSLTDSVMDVVNIFDHDYDCSDEPCDQCGDTIETLTWKI